MKLVHNFNKIKKHQINRRFLVTKSHPPTKNTYKELSSEVTCTKKVPVSILLNSKLCSSHFVRIERLN